MPAPYTPTHSETLVFIGAGATATLGMPPTDDQSKILRSLSAHSKRGEANSILKKYFSEKDLSKLTAFLSFLDGSEESNFLISDSDLENAQIAFGNFSNKQLLQKRIMNLRRDYDWNALRKIIKICPHSEYLDNLIRDAYSIIDKKLLAHQSLKVGCCLNKSGNDISYEEILSPSRLQGARNFLTLFINMLFAGAWYNISKGEKSDEFSKYKNFIKAFDRLMQEEGIKFAGQSKKIHSRDFYLFSTSFVSFNFEMVFPWIFMNSHYELNHHPPFIQDHPLKLWLDYGVEHRGRKLENDMIVPTLEFTESVASRENENDHIGTPINRAGKFYFAHGSFAWRECPVCGRMTFFHGNNDWGDYKSKKMIPAFPIPLFESDKTDSKEFTQKENDWRKELKYDSLQCMHCGSETKALDAPMIMQTMYKSTPTSFLEELQRNVKVSLEKARHIVLLGYRLPPDDTIWQHAFAEGIRARAEKDKAFCTVVVGHKGEEKWINPDELDSYIKKFKDKGDGYGIDAIKNAIAIFGKDNVRAWTGGIPQVFGNCTEADVKELLYPRDFGKLDWKNTRIEE